MKSLADNYDFSTMAFLHFAPEAFFRSFFEKWFGSYTTADLLQPGVDYNVDLTDLPFSNQAYDIVYASHVLEHIKDDRKALSEIRRILKPGGFAILPLPLVADVTVEYPEANPHESGHVRAPGFDYFQRYKEYFDSVEEYGTKDYPSEYQLYIYEDRSVWPTKTMPLRPPMRGDKHVDIVPVCHIKK
jgi:SAM-dependent methyltransferase